MHASDESAEPVRGARWPDECVMVQLCRDATWKISMLDSVCDRACSGRPWLHRIPHWQTHLAFGVRVMSRGHQIVGASSERKNGLLLCECVLTHVSTRTVRRCLKDATQLLN